MKNKFQFGDRLFTSIGKSVIVLDFELINGFYLYYTSDGSAYPETNLNRGMHKFVEFYTLTPQEQYEVTKQSLDHLDFGGRVSFSTRLRNLFTTYVSDPIRNLRNS
jgi:hypothetical protein